MKKVFLKYSTKQLMSLYPSNIFGKKGDGILRKFVCKSSHRVGERLLFFFSAFLFLITGGESLAQQLPFSSQYYTNPFVINPACTGINEKINAFITHRSQWTGLKGAPQTSYFTIDGPIKLKNSSSGIKIYSDVTDIVSKVGAFANYAYKININDSNAIYLGATFGVLNNKIDFSKALIVDADDPFLSQQSQNKTIFSADIGLIYIWKKLTVGIAIPQILGNKFNYDALNKNSSYYTLNRHYQGTLKYIFNLSKEKEITAFPLIMVRAVKGAPIQFDFNAVVDWKKTGWLGLTYHSNNAIAISAGMRYRNLSLGYAYDIGISKIRSYTGASSEFLLGYIFGNKKPLENRFVKEEVQKTDTATYVALVNSDSIKLLNAQLIAKNDTNQVEITKLKEALAKTKVPVKELGADTVLNNDTESLKLLLAQAKAASQANQLEVEKLKAELEVAKAFAPSNSDKKENDELNIVQDSVKKENDELKIVKEAAKKEIEELKKQQETANKGLLETKQLEIDKLKAEIELSKTAKASTEILAPLKTNIIAEDINNTASLSNITLEKMEVGKKVILNNISFAINKSILSEESFSELERIAKLIKNIPSLKMEISGHTDNLGSVDKNQELSELRAKAVMDFLISKGCDKNSLTFKGYGSRQAIESNETEEGRGANRRTEFKILQVDGEYNLITGAKPRVETEIKTDKTATPSNIDKAEDIVKTKTELENKDNNSDALKKEIQEPNSQLSNENQALLAQIKLKSESSQAQIDQLLLEQAKSKMKGAMNPSAAENAILLAELKLKTENNQAQIEKILVGQAKSKITGSMSPSTDELAVLLGQLKAKADTNQIQLDYLSREMSETKGKKEEFSTSNTGKLIDSIRASLSSEIEGLRAQLIIKSDSNQIQINRLKADLEKSKQAEASLTKTLNSNPDLELFIAQQKAKSDTNQAQFEKLKLELEKAKLNSGENAPQNDENNILLAKLFVKTDTNQNQIDRLKIELEKSKNSETALLNSRKINDSLLRTFLIGETDALLTQLKIKSDSNQANVEQLKAELKKAKRSEIATPAGDETNILLAKLFVKSDSNQAQINQLKEDLAIAKAKETKSQSAKDSELLPAGKGSESIDANALLRSVVEKDVTEQAHSSGLKTEPEKNSQIESSPVIMSTPAIKVRTLHTADFTDEAGSPANDGFYVVIGTFGNKENADRFKATNIIEGHRNTKMIQNQVSKLYNIYVLKTNNKLDADVERAKYKGQYPSVWILKLD